VLYYAPNVTNDDVGGNKPGPIYPFVILPGPHGYSVQFLGQAEAEAVRKEYKTLLDRLCQINEEWCLTAAEAQSSTPHHH
jgi:hypothetical protein